jgi:acyl-ACP thioesterase
MLGVGRAAMRQSGQVWILSRLSVFINRRPKFDENMTIRTWPRGANKLCAIRDYDIHFSPDIAGHTDGPCRDTALVRGRSAWLVVDLAKRRPLRPQIAMDNLPLNENVNALPGENPDGNDAPPALAARDYGAAIPVPRRASYSDIDYNGHVNNTRYIQWIQDLLEPEMLKNAKQLRLDINYLSEVLYGETIALYSMTIDKPELPEASPLHRHMPQPCTAAFALEGRRGTGGEAAAVFRAELFLG